MNDAGPGVAATRVVLMARPGPACEHLQEAVLQAGAELVLVVDPTVATSGEVSAATPEAVLVALDPGVEDALDRFDAVLADPAVIVVFDEAGLAAQRTGWDAARWVRHLSAKLNRHGDVLPPGAEPDAAWHPAPGRVARSGAAGTVLDLASFEDEAQVVAPALPGDSGLYGDGLALPEDLEFVDDGSFGFDPALFGAPDAAAADGDAIEVLATHDWDVAIPALDAADPGQPAQADEARAAPFEFDTGSLTLVDDEAPAASAAQLPTGPALVRDLDDLERRVAGIALADVDSYGHGPVRGAVLVEAGLGGPDAVRQLLADLPEAFPRPVLVRLRLDGGRYDRLVRQMDKATALHVALARVGEAPLAGHAYVLAPDIGLAQLAGKLVFADDADPSAPFVALPPGDSAVLFLSGGDPALVAQAMHADWSGALVAGQAIDGCYDALAATEVAARGGVMAPPAELAARLVARWPS